MADQIRKLFQVPESSCLVAIITTRVLTLDLYLNPPPGRIIAVLVREKGEMKLLKELKYLRDPLGESSAFKMTPDGIRLDSHASLHELYHIYYVPRTNSTN